jgi:hypothetical protein
MTASDWTQLREFDGVDLSESYVLGWQLTPAGLAFELDVALTPDHPSYRPPRADERMCWVRGWLRFPAAASVQGLQDQSSVVGATDATGARDYGNIDALSWADGQAHVVGEFGDVTLHSSRPYVTFSEHGTPSV